MSRAKKTDPKLWKKVKDEITASSKGGEPGQWSARKAQLAVQEYQRRGGGYDDENGPGQDETSLHEWTKEDWGTKSGEESGASGERYLPRKVRMLLTEDEYARSSTRKASDTGGEGAQFSDQPEDVRDKVAHIKKHGPTREMLYERAQDIGIKGRSDMTKDELLQAISDATDENGRAKGSVTALEQKTHDALYEMARDRDIEGRSDMTKAELAQALAAD